MDKNKNLVANDKVTEIGEQLDNSERAVRKYLTVNLVLGISGLILGVTSIFLVLMG